MGTPRERGALPEGAAGGRAAGDVGVLWSAWRNLHEHPTVVAWWAARFGWLATLLATPRWRQVLAVAALYGCVARTLRKKGAAVPPGLRVAVVAPALLALAYLVYVAARRYGRLPHIVRRRPQLALHLVFWALLAILWLTPVGGIAGRSELALFTLLLPFSLWRLGYVLKSGQRGKAASTAFTDHLFYQWPLWGGSETPYGKGFDHLIRHQAQTPAAMARSQLAGLKLLMLALLWQAALFCMSGVVYGDADNALAAFLGGYTAGIPRLDDLVRRRQELPRLVAWAGIYCDLIWSTLRIAAKGHVYIGVLRLLGFNVFRNTYKPLLAESIIDFWNRYYYYFKELLVEFFFYPVYARLQVRPWVRTLAAVFAAAFAGNLYYHLIEREALVSGDLADLWATLQARVLYCFLLAGGIAVSMMRQQRRRGTAKAVAAGPLRRTLRIAGVWTFFALIHVWAHAGAQPTFAERTRFALSLFGF